MSALKRTTTLSEAGAVDLPRAVRERHGWTVGERLVVEDRPDGVLITRDTPARLFRRPAWETYRGC